MALETAARALSDTSADLKLISSDRANGKYVFGFTLEPRQTRHKNNLNNTQVVVLADPVKGGLPNPAKAVAKFYGGAMASLVDGLTSVVLVYATGNYSTTNALSVVLSRGAAEGEYVNATVTVLSAGKQIQMAKCAFTDKQGRLLGEGTVTKTVLPRAGLIESLSKL